MKKSLNVRELLAGMMAENTILIYENAWAKYRAFAGSSEIEANTLVEWRQYLVAQGAHSANTINGYLKGIKAITKQLYARKLVNKDTHYEVRDVEYLPNKALMEKRRPHNKVHIAPQQMRQLCSVLNDDPMAIRDRAFMLTLATTGCRISEALAIKVQDIHRNVNNCCVSGIIGKWQEEARTAPLSTEAHDAILEWLALRPIDSPHIFTGISYDPRTGDLVYSPEPVKRQAMGHRIKKYGEEIGLPHIKAHDFRRFVATQVIQKHGIRSAQQVLGHADISTTAAYDTAELKPQLTESLF